MTITYNTILVQNITLSFNIANRILQIEAETHQPGYRPKTKIDKPKVTSRPNSTNLPMCAQTKANISAFPPFPVAYFEKNYLESTIDPP